MMYHTLTFPSGAVIRFDKLSTVEAVLVQMIRRDGFPTDRHYTIRQHWLGDGRWCAAGTELQRTVLGVDKDGYYDLDDSGCPRSMGEPRFPFHGDRA